MGKVSIIAAIIFSVIGFILLGNMQEASRETDIKQADHLSSQLARDLAEKGRKMILATWMASGGTSFSPETQPIMDGGGEIWVDPSAIDFDPNTRFVDFKVRGTYGGSVHEIRSRFRYNNFQTDVIQLKAADIDLTIENGTYFDEFTSIGVDTQALEDLESMIVDDLEIVPSLASIGLGFDDMYQNVTDELDNTGNGDVIVNVIDSDFRSEVEQNPDGGLYYADQVIESIGEYIIDNPGSELTFADGNSFPSSFGGSSHSVLRIQDDVTIAAGDHVSGAGILIVEGDLIVEDNASFTWDGLIAVIPPASNMNPQIEFSGPTTIDGMVVALQETIPNSGHMDVTAFRDFSGNWASSYGVDMYQSFWPWWLYHTHDYTSQEGNSVVFYAPTAGERIHEDHIHLHDTFSYMSPSDSIFFELFNRGNHGRAIMSVELNNPAVDVSFPVAGGIDSLIVDPNDNNRTQGFKISELQRLQIDVTRLSSLKKMWDDSENPFPDCTTWGGKNGAICVGETHYRQNAFTLRMYKLYNGTPIRVYETAMYWHRQEAEEEDFENEMNDLVTQITSADYGLDFTLGDSTNFVMSDSIITALSPLGEIRQGFRNLTNLGTWHQHWEAHEPGNPLNYVTPSSDD